MADAPLAAVTDPDDEEVAVEPDVPDEVKLLDSGRVRFIIDGTTYTLRRPKLGELKEFRQRYAEMQEIARSVVDTNDPDAVQKGYDLALKITRWCFTKFGDKRLPAKGDDLPPWLETPNLLNKMQQHWQTVPLASGVR